VIDVRWPAAGSRLEAISHSETGETAFSLIVMRENSFTTRDLCGCEILSRGFGNGIPSTSDMVFHLHLMKAAGRRAIAPDYIPPETARLRALEDSDLCRLRPAGE
jgi:hypothetical protein